MVSMVPLFHLRHDAPPLPRPLSRARVRGVKAACGGFTLIELMVVMTIVALLLTLAVPRYFNSVDKAKEATLRQDLRTMREAIDKFYGDHDRYPESLEELAARKYLRAIPPDPLTDNSATWVIVTPDDGAPGTVYDIRSGASGTARDGTPYADW